MKHILVLLLLALQIYCINIFAQEIEFKNSPYNRAPDYIQGRKSFQREKWFYEQRIYPYNFLPDDAYEKAYLQKKILHHFFGYAIKNGSWYSLGPTPGLNLNYGDVSSRIVTVKYNPSNPNIIYVGTACGGVWKTTNGGTLWIPLTDFEVSLASGALAIDYNNTDIIYIGTGEATYFTYSYYGRGLLKSTNGGINWVQYRNGLPDLTYFSRLVIKPGNSNVLFAALGTAGLYKSTNAGESWSLAASGRCDDIVFSPDGSKAYIVGSGTGYKISTNGGETFTTHTSFSIGTRSHLAIFRGNPEILYATTYRDTTVYAYKSTNGGYNYAVLPNTFTGSNQAWYDYYIHVNPNDENNVFIGLVDLWRTLNGKDFVKITNTSSGPVHVDHHNLDFHPANQNTLIIANDGGVNQSTNKGTNWINLNSTLNLTQFYRIASDPGNSLHIIGGTQDNGVQRTTGELKWNVVYGGDGGEVCFNPKETKYILTENQFNAIRRSTDGGMSWVSAVSGLSGTAAWIAPIIAHPDSSGVFYTARQQLFKTTNNAASWAMYSTGLSGIVRELAMSKSNPKIILATVNNLIYKSNDGGKIFTILNNTLPNRIITSLNIHPDSSETVITTLSGFGGGHIYKSTNGGLNWFDISGNLPDSPVNDGMFYYPGYSTSVYLVASDVGVFMTNDYGNSWSELSGGLPNTICIHLDYNLFANKLRVATHGRGVWEYNGNIIGLVDYVNIIPEKTILYQNYPNPFNSKTKIEFDLREKQFVRLTIYNILGKEIETSVNKILETGRYSVNFSSEELASGIYYYVLRTDKISLTKVMIILK
ncbi:MAG: T9SS type A sorting domain-containing protein [Ignavibacteria bacterium]|nr:T9SS type A sorting domain-containing protein [Ignavibacteria bacterium]